MRSLSRYYLSQHNGRWFVVDAERGCPAKVEIDDQPMLLWNLSKEDAERWSLSLNRRETEEILKWRE